MSAKSVLAISAAVLFLASACSYEPAPTGRGDSDRNTASDHKSDSAEPVDAAGRIPDNAGKCIAGACADSSPPTSP
jgi:hypothetical protein